MTEIPEHLLKRSRERRAALGLPTEGGDAAPRARRHRRRRAEVGVGAGQPSAATPGRPPARRARRRPAAAAAAQARPALRRGRQAPAQDPDLGHARARPPAAVGVHVRRWPCGPRTKKLTGPLAAGAEVFGQCSSCHGTGGEGGVGYPFADGVGAADLPERSRTRSRSSSTGSQVYAGKPYGDPNRPGGPHIGLARNGSAMPSFERRRSPRPRSSPSSATSATRSAAATRPSDEFARTGARPTRPKLSWRPRPPGDRRPTPTLPGPTSPAADR